MNLNATNRPETSASSTARAVFVCPARRGFSLLELVIVLMIVGVFAAIAAPRYGDSVARYRIELAAKRIITDLAMAAARAKSRSESQTVSFNAESHSYAVPGLADRDRGGGDYTVSLSADPYRVLIKSADIGGDEEVVFNGFGLPDSGGEIIIMHGPLTRTIIVDPTTGAASIQ